jgi:hypothetical protein
MGPLGADERFWGNSWEFLNLPYPNLHIFRPNSAGLGKLRARVVNCHILVGGVVKELKSPISLNLLHLAEAGDPKNSARKQDKLQGTRQ